MADQEVGTGDRLSALFSDRNFQSLLAGMGQKFGAGGVGEMIGQPTQSLIQSLATQEALGKQEKERQKWNKMLLQMMSGVSPVGEPGPDAVTLKDGKATIQMSTPTSPLPTTENRTPSTTALGTPASFAGAPSATPAAPTPSGRTNMSNALGFLRAPLV